MRELDAGEFLANLDGCTSVYAAAMDPPGYQLPGRHSIMERHAGYLTFRAIAVTQATAVTQASADSPAGRPGRSSRLRTASTAEAASGGMTWCIRRSSSRLGRRAADDWLADSFEIAEVHVLPGHQGQGIGLAMMLRLSAGRPERTAVLSTMDADTRARRLYRGLGFTDLLAGFAFAGTDVPYAIMGAPLPLREAAACRPERPSRS